MAVSASRAIVWRRRAALGIALSLPLLATVLAIVYDWEASLSRNIAIAVGVLVVLITGTLTATNERRRAPGTQAETTMLWDVGWTPFPDTAYAPDLAPLYKVATEEDGVTTRRITPYQAPSVLAGLARLAAHNEYAPLLTSTRELSKHDGALEAVWRERTGLRRGRIPIPRPYKIFAIVNATSSGGGALPLDAQKAIDRWAADWPTSALVVLCDPASSGNDSELGVSEAAPGDPKATPAEIRAVLVPPLPARGQDRLDRLDSLRDDRMDRFSLAAYLAGRKALWLSGLRAVAPVFPIAATAVLAAAVLSGNEHGRTATAASSFYIAFLVLVVAPVMVNGAVLVVTWPDLWHTGTIARRLASALVGITVGLALGLLSTNSGHIRLLQFGWMLSTFLAVDHLLRTSFDLRSRWWSTPRPFFAASLVWMIASAGMPEVAGWAGVIGWVSQKVIERKSAYRFEIIWGVALVAHLSIAMFYGGRLGPWLAGDIRTAALAGLLVAASALIVGRVPGWIFPSSVLATLLRAAFLLAVWSPRLLSLVEDWTNPDLGIPFLTLDRVIGDTIVTVCFVIFVLRAFLSTQPDGSQRRLGVVVGLVLMGCTDLTLDSVDFYASPESIWPEWLGARFVSGSVVIGTLLLAVFVVRDGRRAGATVGWLYSLLRHGLTLVAIFVLGSTAGDLAAWALGNWFGSFDAGYVPRALYWGILHNETLWRVVLLSGAVATVATRRVACRSVGSLGLNLVIPSKRLVRVLESIALLLFSVSGVVLLLIWGWALIPQASLLLGSLLVVRRYSWQTINPILPWMAGVGLIVPALDVLIYVSWFLAMLGGPVESMQRRIRLPDWRAVLFTAGLLACYMGPALSDDPFVSPQVSSFLPLAVVALICSPARADLEPWSSIRERHLRLRHTVYVVAVGLIATLAVELVLVFSHPIGVNAAGEIALGDLAITPDLVVLAMLIPSCLALLIVVWVSGAWYMTSICTHRGLTWRVDEARWAQFVNTMAEHGWLTVDGSQVRVSRVGGSKSGSEP
jgi:hypothetical protein